MSMFSTIRASIVLAFLAIIITGLEAQQKVNANSGVQWPNTCTGRLVWSPSQQACIQLTAADIAVFAVGVHCTVQGNYEIGFATTNPNTCTISFSQTPTSGTLSDGTNTVSLSSPWTTGVLPYSYAPVVQSTVTFTATLNTASASATAQSTANWLPRVFGGVGTASATGATAAGTSAVLSGATGTLTSAGIGNQSLYGPYSPSGQKIYILTSGGSHTFKDANSGFPFPFNAPTCFNFVNQYTVSTPLCLYESVNTLYGTFSLSEAN